MERTPEARMLRCGRGHDRGGDGVVALGLDRRSQRQHLLVCGAGGAATTRTTSAWRSVSVPVLSKTTPSTLASRSSTSPLRMKMPIAAARPHPTIIATGAARPMAHGQATSRTARPLRTALPRLPTTSHQATKVTAAPIRTAGTKTLLIRSAIRCSGALSRWASSTRRCRRASTDSAATAVTRTTSTPLPFRVPPVTGSPGSAVHRKRLAGQHRLVHRRPSRNHRPVEREGLAGAHPDQGADRDALGGDQLPLVVVRLMPPPGRRRPQGQQRVHGPGGPGTGPGLDRPPGDQDGHDERGHHPVQAGGERAAASEMEMAPAEGDGLDGADRQGGQGSRGR